MADVIQNALAPLNDKVEIAFIFGSVAQGKERVGSDIDLFVVGDVSFNDVVGVLSEIHQQLGREINPVIMNRLDLQRKSVTDPFIG